jgi:uncharacterized RDD family membrane protein YckC
LHDTDPYAAPQAALVEVPVELPLGGRGERLGAQLIDGLILLAVVLPMMYVGGYFGDVMRGERPGWGARTMWGLIAFVLMIAIQGVPLARSGQTWGKKILKLRIVDREGRRPEFLRLVGLRYATTQLMAMIPGIGALYGLLDALFIFRADKRCLHDLIAGTRVVVAD